MKSNIDKTPECLRCFTINEEIVPGIKVALFESVIPTSDDAVKIERATIQTIPLLSGPVFSIKRTFSAASQLSLSFIREADTAAQISKEGVILAVDSKWWVPASDKTLISILDPCGSDGHVLLFIRKNCKHALLSAYVATRTLSIDNQGMPQITRTNRADMLLNALYESNQTSLVSLAEASGDVPATAIIG